MAWRIHLSNQAIQSLDILPGNPTLLAAWLRRDRVLYYDLAEGIVLDDLLLPTVPAEDRQSELWQEFVAGLVAPNNAYLPLVHTPQVNIYTSEDGKLRLYHEGDTDLFLETDGAEVRLEVEDAETFLALELDRVTGVVAALDEKGMLHLHQQNVRIGAFDIGLQLQNDLQPKLAIARGSAALYTSDGQQLVMTDVNGEVLMRIDPHHLLGEIACSPDGRWVATSDLETGVIRVYDGATLLPLYQRFAIDLLANATQLQLLADMPPAQVAASALTIGDDGALAFALSGVICVTEVEALDRLPLRSP